jgi:hypothetical protein
MSYDSLAGVSTDVTYLFEEVLEVGQESRRLIDSRWNCERRLSDEFGYNPLSTP